MRYFLDPFVFEDPQMKREINRQHEPRRNNECYYPPQYHHQSFSRPTTMGRCAYPILTEDASFAAQNGKKNRQRQQQQQKYHPFQGGGGLEFLVFPSAEALNGGGCKGRKNSPFQGRTYDCRKPCKTPSPSPTTTSTNPTRPKQNTTRTFDPFLELLFAGAPTDRRQPRDHDRIREQASAEAIMSADDDASLFQLLFPGAAASRVHRRPVQKLAKQAFHQAILEKVLEEEEQKRASCAARRRAPTATSRRQQHQKQNRRQHQSYEQAIQEAILKEILGESNTVTKKDAFKPAKESSRTSLTSEPKKNERNVTFVTSPSSSAAYQLPQQFHAKVTDQALILSIDVAGFEMDDLNLQVDPIIRNGGSSAVLLSLAAKRTNTLGEVWELKQSKTLSATNYKINAVEATCDDNILKITIPKRTRPESTNTSNVQIPIHATDATTNHDDDEEEEEEEIVNEGDEDNAKPFSLGDLFEAIMTTDAARANDEAIKNNKDKEAASKAKNVIDEGEKDDEAPVEYSFEDLLRAMVDQFEQQAYQEGGAATDPNIATSESSDTTEQLSANKEVKARTGIESKQEGKSSKPETALETLPTPGGDNNVAVKSETKENFLVHDEPNPDGLENVPRMKSPSSNEESASRTFVRITNKADDDDDEEDLLLLFAPETENVLFEPVLESTTKAAIKPAAEDSATVSSTEKKKKKNHPNNSDELAREDSSLNVLDSSSLAEDGTEDDLQSWENVAEGK